MNSIKFLTAAALLAAATSSAFASELDGKADNAWLEQTAISQQVQAPAPIAAAADTKQAVQSDSATQQDTNTGDYLMP